MTAGRKDALTNVLVDTTSAAPGSLVRTAQRTGRTKWMPFPILEVPSANRPMMLRHRRISGAERPNLRSRFSMIQNDSDFLKDSGSSPRHVTLADWLSRRDKGPITETSDFAMGRRR